MIIGINTYLKSGNLNLNKYTFLLFQKMYEMAKAGINSTTWSDVIAKILPNIVAMISDFLSPNLMPFTKKYKLANVNIIKKDSLNADWEDIIRLSESV